jgi:hypothetical protein
MTVMNRGETTTGAPVSFAPSCASRTAAAKMKKPAALRPGFKFALFGWYGSARPNALTFATNARKSASTFSMRSIPVNQEKITRFSILNKG